MFKKKKSQGTGGVSTLVTGAAGGDSKKTKSQKRHDVALALKGQDKDAVRAAAKEASDAAVKEGKKKMGYLKRGVEAKMLERIIGDLEHSEEEKERRAEMERSLSTLKRTKDLTQGTLDAADRMVVSRIELANGIHGFSELLKSKAKVAGSQQFRTLAGLAQGYVDLIGSTMLNHVDTVNESVNEARDAKEEYYQVRLYHDKFMVQSKDEQTKLTMDDGTNEKKKLKIEETLARVSAQFDEYVVHYADHEQKVKDSITAAMALRDEKIILAMQGMVSSELQELEQTSTAMEPLGGVLEQTRVNVESNRESWEEKVAYLLDESKFPDVGLAHIPTADVAPTLAPAAPAAEPFEAETEAGAEEAAEPAGDLI